MAKRERKPAERRKRGTGQIVSSGRENKPHRAVYPLPGGRKRTKDCATRPEAEAWLTEQAKKEHDDDLSVAGGGQSFGAFSTQWLNDRLHVPGKRGKPIKPKTLAFYTLCVEYARPFLKSLRLDEIDADHINAMSNQLLHEGLSTQTVEHIRTVVGTVLASAKKRHYVKHNAAHDADSIHVVPERATMALEPDAARAVIACAPLRLRALYACYVVLGLREGEGLGLRTKDYDPAARTLTIAQQYTAINGKVLKGTPKSDRPRTLPVPAPLAALLDARLIELRDEQTTEGRPWAEHGLLFPSTSGTPISPRNLVRGYKATLKRAKLSNAVTVHDLRHTCGTRLSALGASDNVVRAVLGHSAGNVTQRYTDHLELDVLRPWLGKWAALVVPPPAEGKRATGS